MKRKFFASLVAFCLLFYNVSAFAAPAELQEDDSTEMITVPYDYPITHDSPEWKEYTSLKQRIEACRVPRALLERMTTAALAETVLNYPLLVNLFAFGSIENGIDVVSHYFAGVEILLAREDAAEVLSLLTRAQRFADGSNGDRSLPSFAASHLLGVIQDRSSEIITSSGESETRTGVLDQFVWTPNGNAVPVVRNSTWGAVSGFYEDDENDLTSYYLATYTSTKKIASISPAYNCHSYAWYSQSSSNNAWMANPHYYMYDGSYSGSSARVNAKVTYIDTDRTYGTDGYYQHSAIMVKTSSGTTPSIVRSKWDANCVFEHYINDCPYAHNQITDMVTCWY